MWFVVKQKMMDNLEFKVETAKEEEESVGGRVVFFVLIFCWKTRYDFF